MDCNPRMLCLEWGATATVAAIYNIVAKSMGTMGNQGGHIPQQRRRR